MDWWERAKERMKERDLSVAELSKASGLNYNTVYKMLRGRVQHPRGNNLEALAKGLGVTEEWLLFEREENPINRAAFVASAIDDVVPPVKTSVVPMDAINRKISKVMKNVEINLVLQIIQAYVDSAAQEEKTEAVQWLKELQASIKEALDL